MQTGSKPRWFGYRVKPVRSGFRRFKPADWCAVHRHDRRLASSYIAPWAGPWAGPIIVTITVVAYTVAVCGSSLGWINQG